MDSLTVIYIILETLIALLASVTNGLILRAIYKRKHLQTIPNRFISSLAMADFLVGFIAIPCTTLSYCGIPFGDYETCLLINTAGIVFTLMSVFCILAIAIERFIAIRWPYVYESGLIGQHPNTIIGATWWTGVFIGMVPFFGWNKGPPAQPESCHFASTIDLRYMVYMRFFICHSIPMVLIPAMYFYIFHIVRKQSKVIAELEIYSEHAERKQNKLDRDMKAARSLLVLVIVFFICWLPINVMNTIIVLSPSTRYNSELYLIATLMTHICSAVNPFVYALSKKYIRFAVKKFFGYKITTEFTTEAIVRSNTCTLSSGIRHISGVATVPIVPSSATFASFIRRPSFGPEPTRVPTAKRGSMFIYMRRLSTMPVFAGKSTLSVPRKSFLHRSRRTRWSIRKSLTGTQSSLLNTSPGLTTINRLSKSKILSCIRRTFAASESDDDIHTTENSQASVSTQRQYTRSSSLSLPCELPAPSHLYSSKRRKTLRINLSATNIESHEGHSLFRRKSSVKSNLMKKGEIRPTFPPHDSVLIDDANYLVYNLK